jgi:hypothetical protein
VVEAAAQVDAAAALERAARGERRAAGGEPVGAHDLGGERQLRHVRAVRPAQRVEVVEVLRRVRAQQVLARRGDPASRCRRPRPRGAFTSNARTRANFSTGKTCGPMSQK